MTLRSWPWTKYRDGIDLPRGAYIPTKSVGTYAPPAYNALGQRVRDVTTTTTTDEAYGAGGNLLWRYTGSSSTNRSFVPFSGGILAEYYSGGTLFDHPDELGSIAASTSYNGGPCQELLFYPFGELWTGAGSCGMRQTFGKLPDYDAETDQYNTLNRHYTPSGRWMSPDPFGGQLVDPETLNKYAYARNDPTTLTDPLGLYICADDPSCKSDYDRAFESARKVDLKSKNADVVRAAKSYGDPTKDNGVTVQFGDPEKGGDAETSHSAGANPDKPGGLRAVETVTIKPGLSEPRLDAAVGHEGSHVADAQDFVASINATTGTMDTSKNLTTYQTELKAYMVTQSVLATENARLSYGDCGMGAPCALGAGTMGSQVTETINQLLANPANHYGAAPNYGVTPANPGPVLYPALTTPH